MRKIRRPLPRRAPVAIALVAAALGLAALPATSSAAVTVGSNLIGDADSNVNECAGTCTFAQVALDPSHQAPGGLVAPSDGVITRWRLESASAGGTMFLRVLRPSSSDSASYSGQGRSTPETAQIGLNTWQTRLRISAGDRIGLDNATEALVFDDNGLGLAFYWTPQLGEGETRARTGSKNYELMLNADIEPDADNDGFGDETQDQCPTDPARQGPCAAADTSPPVIERLTMRRRFRAGPRRGTRVRYRLSEDARVRFRVQRRTRGRYRYLRGSFTRSGSNGENSFRFRGRLRGRNLRPGSYRLVARATDPSSNLSAPKRRRFRIVG